MKFACALVAANHYFLQTLIIDLCFYNGISLFGTVIRRYCSSTTWARKVSTSIYFGQIQYVYLQLFHFSRRLCLFWSFQLLLSGQIINRFSRFASKSYPNYSPDNHPTLFSKLRKSLSEL